SASGCVRFARSFHNLNAPNIRILLHASAVHITTDETSTLLREVEVANPEGRRATVRAKALVLCAGGIVKARLLLVSNRIVPGGLGNRCDLVGRCLMDHPRCTIGDFGPEGAMQVRERYGRRYTIRELYYRNDFIDGLAVAPAYQRSMGLLN